jgi:hypothetical protein
MKQQIPARVLAFEHAATMVDGVSELSRRLSVAERQLDYWMRDIGSPPDTVFFDVTNIMDRERRVNTVRNAQVSWPAG